MLASDAEREELLVEFARPGLERGERVWCVTEDVWATEHELARGGIDVGEAIGAGRLRVLSPRDAYLAATSFRPADMVGTLHDAVDDALAAGFHGFRLAGDMRWAAGARGGERLEEYETRVDEVLRARPAAALCQYDWRCFDGERLDGLRALHRDVARVPMVSGDGTLRIHRLDVRDGAVWLRLSGEADVSSAGALEEALDDLAATTGDVRVDMTRLRFMDVSGLRPLGVLAERRRLVLHHPPAEVRRLVELLGVRLPPIELVP